MSNKTRLQTNNTNLQALIDKANALPDAGGSGGGNIETCEVIFDHLARGNDVEALCTRYVNNAVQSGIPTIFSDDQTIENAIIKNTDIYMFTSLNVFASSNGYVSNLTSEIKRVYVTGDTTITIY